MAVTYDEWVARRSKHSRLVAAAFLGVFLGLGFGLLCRLGWYLLANLVGAVAVLSILSILPLFIYASAWERLVRIECPDCGRVLARGRAIEPASRRTNYDLILSCTCGFQRLITNFYQPAD